MNFKEKKDILNSICDYMNVVSTFYNAVEINVFKIVDYEEFEMCEREELDCYEMKDVITIKKKNLYFKNNIQVDNDFDIINISCKSVDEEEKSIEIVLGYDFFKKDEIHKLIKTNFLD